MEVILFGFSFSHHGKYSAFNGLVNSIKGLKVIDATINLPFSLQPRVRTLITNIFRKLSEYRLYPYYRSRERHLFHYFFPENSLFSGWKWKNNHSLVLTCHQPYSKLATMRKNREHFGFFKGLEVADVVIVLSKSEIDYYRELAPRATVINIPHGVDVEHFFPEPKNFQDPVILTVGNWLRDYKCWASVVEKVSSVLPTVSFIVVANPDTINFARYCLSKEYNNVIYLSGVSDDELVRIYNKASALFLPLYDAVANNALLEAMACGIPTVVSDLPATREYLSEDSGILVGEHKAENYSEELLKLIGNPELIVNIGNQARVRAVREYSWKNIASQYLHLYDFLGSNE
jgi:glycosyltransferase involved in cell wall biosynthesis